MEIDDCMYDVCTYSVQYMYVKDISNMRRYLIKLVFSLNNLRRGTILCFIFCFRPTSPLYNGSQILCRWELEDEW